MFRSARRTTGALALCAGAACAAQPITSHWLNPVSGNWTDGSMWSSAPYYPSNGQAFGSLFHAVIDAAGAPYEVTMGLGGPTVSLQSLTMQSADATLNIARLRLAKSSHVSAGRLRMAGTAAELFGEGDLSIAGELQWTAGTMSGSGTTTIESAGRAVFDSFSYKYIARTFVNNGDLTWTNGRMAIVSNGALVNNGVMTIGGLALPPVLNLDGSSTFTNNGSLHVKTSLEIGGVQFTNAGEMLVESLTRFFSGITNNGSITVAANRTLRVDSDSTYAVGSSIVGGGSLVIGGGSHVITEGALELAGRLIVLAGDVTLHERPVAELRLNGGTVRFEYLADFGGVMATSSNLVFNQGIALDSGAAVTIGALAAVDLGAANREFSVVDLNGHLAMTGDALITDAFIWRGGSLNGAGVTTLADGASLTMTDGQRTLSRELVHTGDIAWSGGDLLLNGFSFTNHGQMSAVGVGSVVDASGGQAFVNHGDITIGGDFGVLAAFENLGQVHVGHGATLRIGGPVTTGAGGAIVGPGAVDFVAGAHTLDASLLATTGAVRVSGGSVAIDPAFVPASWTFAGGSAQFTGDALLSGAALSGGMLGSAGRLDLDGFVWSGGALVGGGETLVVTNAAIAVEGSAAKTLSRSLVNEGSMTVNGGFLTLSAGAIDNRSTLAIGPGAGVRADAAGGALLNTGLITSSGPGVVSIEGAGLSLVNQGQMQFGPGVTLRLGANVAPGALGSLSIDGDLHFTGGSVWMPASGWALGGGISILGGDTVFASTPTPASWMFKGGRATFQQEFSAGDLLRTEGATLRFEGGVQLNPGATAQTQAGGVLDFAHVDASVGRLVIASGGVEGEADLHVGQQLVWNLGRQSGTGRTILGPDSTSSIFSVHQLTLEREMINRGALTITANALRFDGGVLRNEGDVSIVAFATLAGAGAGGEVVNLGAFRMESSGQLRWIQQFADLHFRNFGLFDLQDGSTFLQSAPSVANHGQYAISQRATLTVDGDFINDSDASLAFAVGGKKDRGLAGLMTITGDASLGGSLIVTTPDALGRVWGERWTVLSFGSLSAEFDAIELPESPDEMLRWYARRDADSYSVGVSHIADIDHDGLIGFADLNVIASNFNASGSWAQGDVDGDGFVGFADLNIVLSLFNVAAPRNVPAPGAVASLLGGLALAGARRRR